MRIHNLDMMSRRKLLEATEAVAKLWDDALAKFKTEAATMPRRMNVAQRERMAYLKGVVAGASQATREFEKRAPMFLVGSASETTED